MILDSGIGLEPVIFIAMSLIVEVSSPWWYMSQTGSEEIFLGHSKQNQTYLLPTVKKVLLPSMKMASKYRKTFHLWTQSRKTLMDVLIFLHFLQTWEKLWQTTYNQVLDIGIDVSCWLYVLYVHMYYDFLV